MPTWLSDDDGIDYSTLEDVGTLFEPDLEAMVALDPDLVIVGNRSQSLAEELSQNFEVFDSSVRWDDAGYEERAVNMVRELGDAVGKADEANVAADAIEAKIAEYQDSAAGAGTALVVMTNAGEISLHDSGSRWAPIWDVFGYDEAYDKDGADEGHQGDKVSFETVAEINPDYMFVVDRDAAVGNTDAGTTAEQVLDNALVNGTNAAKNGHIYYLSPERWYLVMTGATNLQAMLDEVAEAQN